MNNVIIPDSGGGLLRRELALAFEQAGCKATLARPEHLRDETHPHFLPELASQGRSLLFSVNFQGLSRLKEAMSVMQACGGRIAVWCVDNPWNLLSGVRDPQWKELDLFVTDPSFLPGLARHGAARARHLPLAACPGLFATGAGQASLPELAPVVFVGRSAFPDRDAFYAGLTLPEDCMPKAVAMMERGLRPDLSWWIDRFGLATQTFWPGKKERLPSLGAETASYLWRTVCLQKAAASFTPGRIHQATGETSGGAAAEDAGVSLDIFGDEGWRSGLPQGSRLLPPVDYYGRLPAIYARARYSLALTSMQLPKGLNQRHFDVWTAGGVCITDNTPGLALFPGDLVRPVVFHRPGDIENVLNAMESRSAGFRRQLIADWQSEIRARHTYANRVNAVLEAMGRS